MSHYYYSVFSKEYLYKGIILYNSMIEYDKDFEFFLICMDEISVTLLKKMKLKNLNVISIKDIEAQDKDLLNIKNSRSKKTYAWATKPPAAIYIFNNFSYVDHMIWLDGDTCFLSDPQPIYDEWGENSVLLTSEQFTDSHEYLVDIYGKYNTGFMGFKKDEISLKCLEYFREKMLEWKFDKKDEYRWNDQLYVTDWFERFENIGVSNTIAFNLTPFMVYRKNTEKQEYITKKDDGCYIDDCKIVLYHFMGLKYYNGKIFDLCEYWMNFDQETILYLYFDYLRKCKEVIDMINDFEEGFYKNSNYKNRYIGNYLDLDAKDLNHNNNFCTIVSNDNINDCIKFYKELKEKFHTFRFWVCTVDDYSFDRLEKLRLSNLSIINRCNLEDDKLSKVKKHLKNKEYSDALKIVLLYFILKNNINVKKLVFIQVQNFNSLDLKDIFNNWSNKLIIKYTDSKDLSIEKISIYNENAVGVKNSRVTLECLSNILYWWVEKCNNKISEGEGYSLTELFYMLDINRETIKKL